MHFIKLFGSGVDAKDRDVRNKIWAEYHCSLCGEDSDIDVTRVMETFDFTRERKCPYCKLVSAEDKAINDELRNLCREEVLDAWPTSKWKLHESYYYLNQGILRKRK